MGSLPKRSSLISQILRLSVIAIVVLVVGSRMHLHPGTVRVAADPASEPHVAAAQEQAQPLVSALERYRADNGLYPTSVKQLSPAYAASLPGLDAFRYSARRSDWVLQSDACLDREKTLQGDTIKDAKEYEKQVARFNRDCVTGYRDYQLQSLDFPPDGQSRYLERWAYYDSQAQYWDLGWCEQVVSKGRARELATNGVCGFRQPGGPPAQRSDLTAHEPAVH